ncbi:homospermidine synthase [Candidatus Kaiserbacteria bacterium RIFCSPLOWO2_02_FULL_45_11b]|uniref:Homospermidine synthase n=1 Tax=Candidatus Kaiserbacteria bacterium RIFCSPLOWO2_12_FULL_45_26 TaxID=1798525 RepID=A0A1F6FGX1_9BACT|nr:MAG: homospermidine synthase [Candidatus Kaiserbacteria bacterium RIFCSPHIGHO2_12_45_16]OGG69953.1 MAG: homospermidine synthase [Candidatus Kaiserbacteria bacterium RIFCSPLOWO2_01_FULL_45_25]OGG81523.1 MAG: homospermidine synthase [Candidatus Kaiserbacteria bacterium RIFCSPLOWO2_02_FULL_45_11b]OGG85114.1 MAG: homospermidine synthase [Candidatus Kaiserbacteria bacterium RIFCSPLOWO2_12_FULL_45_26]
MTAVPNFKTEWQGPIIIIGFGSIGKGTLPLICRHLEFSNNKIHIFDPSILNKSIAEQYQANFINTALTAENYQDLLGNIIDNDDEQSLIVNLSVDVATKEIIKFAQAKNALYVDTSIDPWAGFYFNDNLSLSERSNYALRESLLELRTTNPSQTTAVSCCGANPGMVSWFVKQALLNLAKDLGHEITKPATKAEWANLMMTLGVKGIHIAERDTQKSNVVREPGQFINTWSVEGLMFESTQPAELGWGTHEKTMPEAAGVHDYGCKAAIYIDKPAATVKVDTWTPSTGNHFAFLITHNEAISIADYFTVKDGEEVIYRPTCHYAYRPTDLTVDSLDELFNNNNGVPQTNLKILTEDEITEGNDELGVLLYGHDKNAYWYGSQLTIEETRELIPHQNATGLQVASAVLTGIIWAINNPQAGLVEVDEIDFEDCLKTQMPYLGKVAGYYTDWNPLKSAGKDISTLDKEDPWQFKNILLQ